MVQLLQGLAWLYAQTEAGALTETALALALRLATTPEQEVVLWCQRGWFVAMGSPAVSQDAAVSAPVLTIIEGLQAAQARCADASLEPVVHGITALLQGQVAQASAALAHVPAVPAFPELQALCTAAWLWAHTQQGTLEQALGQGTSTASLPWQHASYAGPGAGNLAGVDDAHRTTVSGHALVGGAAGAPTHRHPGSTARLVPSWVSASVTVYRLAGGAEASEWAACRRCYR